MQGTPDGACGADNETMLSPTLVHFPDRDPRVVMNVGGATPRAGDEFIQGWIVERHVPAERTGRTTTSRSGSTPRRRKTPP